MGFSIGVVLPHFGDVATVDRVVGAAIRLERAGLDSVWFRDHLAFTPHAYEPRGTRFLDPFTSLAVIAHETERLKLGTATLVPFRHPLIVSQLLGGIDLLGRGGRLIVGVGAGGVREPFDATGQDFERRFEIVDDWVRSLRASWSGPDATHDGPHFPFPPLTMDPRPAADTPIWYGGASLASIRRAVAVADGWIPGRCPMKVLRRLLPRLRELEGDRDMKVGMMPLLTIGSSREDALREVDAQGLVASAAANPIWKKESFETTDDISGLLIAGSPDDCIAQTLALVEGGVEHVVFDVRLRPDAVDEQLELLAAEILPPLVAARK